MTRSIDWGRDWNSEMRLLSFKGEAFWLATAEEQDLMGRRRRENRRFLGGWGFLEVGIGVRRRRLETAAAAKSAIFPPVFGRS